MFASDSQACRAIVALLEASALPPLRGLWTDAGPTERACKLLERGGRGMSRGEALLLRVAFDFWNGRGEAKFADVINVLDPRRLELVGSLMAAMNAGSGAVEKWLFEVGKEAPHGGER